MISWRQGWLIITDAQIILKTAMEESDVTSKFQSGLNYEGDGTNWLLLITTCTD